MNYLYNAVFLAFSIWISPVALAAEETGTMLEDFQSEFENKCYRATSPKSCSSSIKPQATTTPVIKLLNPINFVTINPSSSYPYSYDEPISYVAQGCTTTNYNKKLLFNINRKDYLKITGAYVSLPGDCLGNDVSSAWDKLSILDDFPKTGNYRLTYSATDADDVWVTVSVVDSTPPLLTLKSTSTLTLDNITPDLDVTISDNYLAGYNKITASIQFFNINNHPIYSSDLEKTDDSCENNCNWSPIDIKTYGVYYMTYTIKDSAGNITTKTRLREVDVDSPTISIIGKSPLTKPSSSTSPLGKVKIVDNDNNGVDKIKIDIEVYKFNDNAKQTLHKKIKTADFTRAGQAYTITKSMKLPSNTPVIIKYTATDRNNNVSLKPAEKIIYNCKNLYKFEPNLLLSTPSNPAGSCACIKKTATHIFSWKNTGKRKIKKYNPNTNYSGKKDTCDNKWQNPSSSTTLSCLDVDFVRKKWRGGLKRYTEVYYRYRDIAVTEYCADSPPPVNPRASVVSISLKSLMPGWLPF